VTAAATCGAHGHRERASTSEPTGGMSPALPPGSATTLESKRTMHRAPFLTGFKSLACLLCLWACDEAHREQRSFCASASNDPAKCASRPDLCIPNGGATCVEKVDGADCTQCRPGASERASCAVKPTAALACRDGAARMKRGIFTPLNGGDWNFLDAKILRPRVGQLLSARTIEALSDHDRHVLCSPGTGADWRGKGPCVLAWSPEASRAECSLDKGFCASACGTHLQPFQCIAKNLCNGVVCP
jgi:hypothetical protein